MNPLEQYPAARKILYTVQWVVNIVLAVMSFVFVSLNRSPEWFVITAGAFNLVWTLTGITASGNVTKKEETP